MNHSTIRATGIALTLLAAAACDPSGPDVGPPARLQAEVSTSGRVVGGTIEVSVVVLDAQERAVEGVSVTWSASGDGSMQNPSTTTGAQGESANLWTLDTTPGAQRLTIRAGDALAETSIDVAPGPLTEMVLTPSEDTLRALNDTLEIQVEGLDQYSNPVSLSALSWQSSDPTIASVVDGVVVAHAEGTVDIDVSSSGHSATARVTVDQAIDTIGVDPATPVMMIGETVDLSATPLDARGSAVDTSLTLTWASSAPAVATVDTGVVTAVAAGTTTITATAGGWAGAAEVTVSSSTRPTIIGIAPATLGAGDTATITGTDFGTDPAAVDVTVGGLATTLVTLTDTLLTAELPPPGSFPCEPAGNRDVVVSVDGLTATDAHPVAGAVRHTLAAGGSVALLGGAVACNELTETGTYLISVFNTSASPTIATAFRLQGTGPAAALPSRPRIEVPAPQPMAEPDPMLDGHLRVLERNRRLVETLGPPDHPVRPAPLAAQTVGEVRTFRIPDLDADNICTNYIEVDARAVHVGSYGVIWEDTLAPLAGTMDASWDTVGMEYDTIMHQILLDNFGDPLAYDDRLDANGLFFMLFSESVNDFQSTAVNGFVFSGDFYNRASQCPSSDEGEIFYGRVPTVADTDGFPYDQGEVGDWKWRTRGTVIHEVKHLTMYANKFDVNASTLEETGLEEATARLAEELYGRALQGYGQGDNVTYQESIFCERRVGDNWPECDKVPLIMGKHYGGVNTYMKTPALLSPFGRPDPNGGDASFYGSGWQWVRWAIDQSALTEPEIIKPLVRETTLTGPANLADKVGDRSVAELLADYTLAFAIDDHPSGVVPDRPELTIPSWNTRDIFQGLHDDYAGTATGDTYYPTAWPLATQALTGGAFQVDVAEIHGGGASFFELSGMSGAQLLELLSENGGTAPSSLGLSIVRIQ
jgi:hypothetical protein